MRAVLLLGFGLLTALSAPAAEPAVSEYEVKAAFLLNFTRFVQWPPSAFERPDSPFAICIMGENPFGGALRQLVEGETVGSRRIAVQDVKGRPEPRACQVLFISRSETDIPTVLADLEPGVLTVSDHDGFLRDGGIIAFVTEDRHVRFDINRRAAAKAKLAVSARLLNVARSVRK